MGGSEAIPRGPLTQQQTPEEEWGKVEAVVFTELEKLLIESVDDDNERTEQREIMRLNEKVFFNQVLSTTERAAKEHGSNVNILFDVDETIARNNSHRSDSPTFKTVIRPALYPLLNIFRQKGWRVGLITTRSGLEQQLQEDKYLGSLREFVSPELLFSVREYRSGTPSDEFQKNIVSNYGGPNGVIDDRLVNNTNPIEIPSMGGDQQKIRALVDIKNKIPHGAIVVVDDFPYPRFLNEQNGLYGVSLDFSRKGSGTFRLPM